MAKKYKFKFGDKVSYEKSMYEKECLIISRYQYSDGSIRYRLINAWGIVNDSPLESELVRGWKSKPKA